MFSAQAISIFIDAAVEDVVWSYVKTSSATSSPRSFRSLSRMQFTSHSQTVDHRTFLFNVHAKFIFIEAMHRFIYIYMYSFQLIFYHLIDGPILSIHLIDPLTYRFIIAIQTTVLCTTQAYEFRTSFYFHRRRWNVVTFFLIYVLPFPLMLY